MAEKKRVLIICTGNVARSQMAEGILRHLADDRFEVSSGGLIPSYVRPNAIAVMKEIGIDISHHRSKSLNEFIDTPFDYVITVCDHASQHCPIFPGPAKPLHWSFPDPSQVSGTHEEKLMRVREIRDAIRAKIDSWCAEVCVSSD